VRVILIHKYSYIADNHASASHFTGGELSLRLSNTPN